MCDGQFWEKVGYTFDDTLKGESHMGVIKFWSGGYDPRRHHEIAP